MEQEPPKAYDVGMDALDDIKRNLDLVKQIVLPVLPIMIVLAAIDALAQTYFTNKAGGVEMEYHLFSILYIVVTGWVAVHYVMRWHMFTLLGNVKTEATWLNPDEKYKAFFIKTLILQAAIILAMIIPIFLLMVSPVLGLITMVPIWFIGIYVACRLSFILPATVLGHTPNFKEIWDFAKGIVGKTFWAPIRVTYQYILLFLAYIVVVGVVGGLTGIIDAEGGSSAMLNLLSFILFVLPGLVLGLLFGLVYVGVLSRYYEWGLKNRTDAYGDFK